MKNDFIINCIFNKNGETLETLVSTILINMHQDLNRDDKDV